MQELDRQIQKQIERAIREKLGRVRVTDSIRNIALGDTDLSTQPASPNLVWRKELFDFPLSLYPSINDAKAALNKVISVPRTVSTEIGSLNGGLVTNLNGGIIDPNRDVKGATMIYTTEIYTAAERTFPSRLIADISMFGGGKGGATVESSWFILPFIKSRTTRPRTSIIAQGATETYPDWTALQYLQGQNQTHIDVGLNVTFPAYEWVTLALYVYLGWPFQIFIREVFRDIIYFFDSSRFLDKTPPTAPSWGSPPIQSTYLDESIGTSVNTLKIVTPTAEDWLGVGIYRAAILTNADLTKQSFNRDQVVFSTSANNIDLGRVYSWNIYGATSQPYTFVREEPYQKNLITNGTFLYDTSNWRFTDEGPGASDTIRYVKHEPYIGSVCVKSSAAYSAVSQYNMVITSTAFAVNKVRPYKLRWYVKTEDSFSSSAKPVSALQITYYKDNVHTLCASTSYQLQTLEYSGSTWAEFNRDIYSAYDQATLNSSGQTGASALAYFIWPADCTYAEINFKMHHTHSAESVFYFDGANFEVDSGQAINYNSITSGGTVVYPQKYLTLPESTAYSVMRMPFRGRTSEILFGHSTNAFGENFHLSSAHWSKFAQGIEIAPNFINRAKNGNFMQTWVYEGAEGQYPNGWEKFGEYILMHPAYSTAVYGNRSGGLYWGTVSATGGGLWQNHGASVDKKDVTFGFWLMVDTGAVRIGDANAVAIAYKEPHNWWFTTHNRGIKDAGPPHLVSNEIVVPKSEWQFHQMHMASSWGFHIWSNIQGTRAYMDGLTINWGVQSNGSTRNIPTLFDPYRIVNRSTVRPTSYVHCSANSMDSHTHTIRCWYSPNYSWYMTSTVTGQYNNIPWPTIWSWGAPDTGATTNMSRLYYRPFINSDSSGGYFEWYMNRSGAAQRMAIPGPRIEFKPFDPLHLVLTFTDLTGMERGRFTKLYVNGIPHGSSHGKAVYGTGVWPVSWIGYTPPLYDNIVIGAVKGAETSTAVTFTPSYLVGGTTALGNGLGVISEFRIDNYVWSQEQVMEDYLGEVPRMAPSASLTNIQYAHLTDKIKDGSEKQTLTYEDVGVSAGTVYSYALDAFDYMNNRSPLGDTASITAGDTVPPGMVFDTTKSVFNNVDLYFGWDNPSDSDLRWNKIYTGTPRSVSNLEGEFKVSPNQHISYLASSGGLTYGQEVRRWIAAVDTHNNESALQFIYGITNQDLVAPGEVLATAYYVNNFGDQLSIGWKNPSDSDFRGVLVYATSIAADQLIAKVPGDPNSRVNMIVSTGWPGTVKDYWLVTYDSALPRNESSGMFLQAKADVTAPGPFTSTGYAVNKDTNVTFYWKNPTDSDFAYTRVYNATPPYSNLDIVYGKPGIRSTWNAGFIGYGSSKAILIRAYDVHGNGTIAASETGIVAHTKKGPLKGVDGSIFTNVGYGLINNIDTQFRKDALSWARIYYTTSNPTSPRYDDLRVQIMTEGSATGQNLTVPVKLGSATGLTLDTAYYLYLLDSADGRSNALKMGWDLDPDVAETQLSYPLGKFYTGNSTVLGYFTPHIDVGQFSQGVNLIAPKIESQTGDTYFDLRNSVLKNTDRSTGDYTLLQSGFISYYKKAWDRSFLYPRVFEFIPAGLVNVGASNTFASWGLGTFNNAPTVMFFPERVKTYSTAAGWDVKNQFLDIQVDSISNSAVKPVVALLTEQLIETHLTAGIDHEQMTPASGPYIYPCNIVTTFQTYSGVATSCAWDSATGLLGESGIGSIDSQMISRIDYRISFYASALGARVGGTHIKMNWGFLACSADAVTYQNHGAPAGVHYTHHWGWHTDAGAYKFTLLAGRTKHFYNFTRLFPVPDAYKPLVKWTWCSAQPANYGAQPASEINWVASGTYAATSGARYINDMKLEAVIYYTADGESREQYGYGILNALVVDRG